MNVMPPRTPAPTDVPAGMHGLAVEEVTHYTDTLFHFRTTRPAGFRFRSGEFVMIGLPAEGKPLTRAYSIASPAWDESLAFFSIKVPDGPLTSRLRLIEPGDTVLMRKKATGTLVNDALISGKRLYLLSTGTGIAPFASLIRDPETYEKFDDVILTQTCRTVAELRFGIELTAEIRADAMLNEVIDTERLTFYPTATREPFERTGRITDRIRSGALFTDLGVPPLDPASDRVMICGSMAMLRELKSLLDERGFTEGANNAPGQYVIERAFVD
ncbi:MAG: FAD-binding oxidoreductase [Acuticoccus sp.]